MFIFVTIATVVAHHRQTTIFPTFPNFTDFPDQCQISGLFQVIQVVATLRLQFIHENCSCVHAQWHSQRGAQGARAPTETSPQNFYRLWKVWTRPVNRKVESITGSVFVFVSREAAILAQNALETVWRLRPDPLGSSQRCPRFRGGERWQRKMAGQREGERVRKGEKGGCEWRMGEGWKKAKENRVVPHPKLNPGCATVHNTTQAVTE